MLLDRGSFCFLQLLRQPRLAIAAQVSLGSPRLMLDTLDEQGLTRYQSAVLHLNSLQSNAATIQKIREKRGIVPEKSIQETSEYLVISGLELDDIDKLNAIHVSGTKGKGSTCAFAETILRSQGYKTGLYTSPHLIHVRERIRINSQPISEEKFTEYFFKVYNKLKENKEKKQMPPYFKFLTLMAFHVFHEEKVDVAIIEVGIGGRYDCTNIIRKPKVCGITTLDYDHTSILGDKISEIAFQKAGIIKENVPVVVTPPIPSAMEVYKKESNEKNAPLLLAPDFSSYCWPPEGVSLGIAGHHQELNVSLALQLVRIWLQETGKEQKLDQKEQWNYGEPFKVSPSVAKAVSDCHWPGRSQIVEYGNSRFYLDGAHTPKSMEMCAIWFQEQMENQPRRKRILIFQCTADRNPATLLPKLKDLGMDVAAFSPTALQLSQDLKSDVTNLNQSTSDQLTRSKVCAETWNELTAGGETHVFDCISALVAWVRTIEEPADILVTGSLHLVGGVLSYIHPDLE